MRAAAVAVLALASASPALAGTGNPVAGKAVFRAKCGTCHTFKAAGTVSKGATQGPSLDNRNLKVPRVMKEITGNGLAMPPMNQLMTQKQIDDVTAFVVLASKKPSAPNP